MPQGVYKTYDKMKDSGLEWIGEIPSSWEVMPFKKLIQQNDGGVWGYDPIGEEGVIVLRSTEQTVDGKWHIEHPAKRDLSQISKLAYYQLMPGDLLITKSSGSSLHIGKTSIVDTKIAALQCFYSNFMQRVRLNRNSTPGFYWYILNSSIAREQFVYQQNSTSGIGNINSKHINNIIVPIPPLPEQEAIAAYLDEKCADIDDIIAEAKASIEEYKAWKASVIFEAVTKGLDPNAEMKDSGVAWIGMIPKHWSCVPMKFMLNERNQKNDPVVTSERLSLSIDIGVTLYAEKTTNLDRFKEDVSQYKVAHAGDLVLNSMNMIVGAVGIAPLMGCVSPAYYVFYDNDDSHTVAKFCNYIFKNKRLRGCLFSLGQGIMAIDRGDGRVNTCRLKVSRDDLGRIMLPCPAIEEQRKIISFLDKKCAAIDGIIAEKESLITELETYKKSLIFETVTGKRKTV